MLLLNTTLPAGLMKRPKGLKGSEPHSVALKWKSNEVTAKLKILHWLLPRRKTQSSLWPALTDLFYVLTNPSPAFQPFLDPLMLLNLGVPPTSGSFSPCSLWHDHSVFYLHGSFFPTHPSTSVQPLFPQESLFWYSKLVQNHYFMLWSTFIFDFRVFITVCNSICMWWFDYYLIPSLQHYLMELSVIMEIFYNIKHLNYE